MTERQFEALIGAVVAIADQRVLEGRFRSRDMVFETRALLDQAKTTRETMTELARQICVEGE